LNTSFSGAARRSISDTRTAAASATTAAVVPRPSRIANANASAVVTSLVPPLTFERIGNDSMTTRLASSTQNRAGCCSTVAGPLLTTRSATRASPTAETAST
jgi:hypothetical protein